MTAVCGGGSSEPKDGYPSSLYVGTAYIQSLLPPVLAFLYPYLPFMQGLSIGNVGDFCSTDPPTIPSMPSASSFLSYVTGGPIGEAQAVSDFLVALTRAYLWYEICQCSSGTPTPITPPSDPGDLPVINPPQIPPPSGSPCLYSVSDRYEITDFNDFANMLPTGPLLHSSDPKPNMYAPLPAGASSFVAHWDTGPFIDSTHRYNITLAFWDAALAFHGVQSVTNRPSGASGSFTGTISSTWIYYQITVSSPDTGPYPSGNSVGCNFTAYCGGSGPSTPATPCCPPDPIQTGLLQQIMSAVTLIQRQLAPFAYVPGSTHSGLTGQGEISVQGLLGIKIELDLPGRVGETDAHPDVVFDAGWINWGNDDGFSDREMLHANPQVSLPMAASQYTRVGYSLTPGVSATIVELVREP